MGLPVPKYLFRRRHFFNIYRLVWQTKTFPVTCESDEKEKQGQKQNLSLNKDQSHVIILNKP